MSFWQRIPVFRDHPPGLGVCFLVEMWERFSYYGMRALLIFYLTQHFLFSDSRAFVLYGAYASMVYLLPVLGGAVADPLARPAQGGHVRRAAAGRRSLPDDDRGAGGGRGLVRGRARRRAQRLPPEPVLLGAGPDRHGRRIPQDERLHRRRRPLREGRPATGLRLHGLLHGDQPGRGGRTAALRVARPDLRLALRIRSRRRRHAGRAAAVPEGPEVPPGPRGAAAARGAPEAPGTRTLP